LDEDRVELLSKLAKKTGQTQQAMLRAALDAVLIEHKLLKAKRKP